MESKYMSSGYNDTCTVIRGSKMLEAWCWMVLEGDSRLGTGGEVENSLLTPRGRSRRISN